MALIICPECEKSISEYAQACPSCGFPVANPPDAVPANAGTNVARNASTDNTSASGSLPSNRRKLMMQWVIIVAILCGLGFLIPATVISLLQAFAPDSRIAHAAIRGTQTAAVFGYALLTLGTDY